MGTARTLGLAGALAVVVSLALVAWWLLRPDTSPAVWRPAPGAVIDEQTTTFDVVVSRVECSSGRTGDVVDPDIEMRPDEVVVRFRVSPGTPREATCPGNEWVPYSVALEGPLGDRRLVDGECLDRGAGAGTSECRDDQGVRYTP
ncbi:hypothetical protein [Nocardioides salarius]|uniref:hypothetical protein n=1 Tax=Nocardioides salarius TaxID=374513 RepID=UPI0030F83437